MSQLEILEEIKKLSPVERLALIEAALQLTRQDLQPSKQKLTRAEKRERMAKAAELLLPDYLNDEELTAFTALDGEDFYEYDER